jgi:hypothetical protein
MTPEGAERPRPPLKYTLGSDVPLKFSGKLNKLVIELR